MAICGYEFPDEVVCGQSLGHEPPHIKWGRSSDVKYHQRWIEDYERRIAVHQSALDSITAP